MRNKLSIQFGLAGLILVFGLGVYYVYSDMRAKTMINTVEANFIEKINRAYNGEQAAHDEIVRRIPVLTKSRLVKNTRQAEPISQSLVRSSDSEATNNTEAAIEPAVSGSSKLEVARTSQLKVYLSQKPGAPVIATLVNDAQVLNIKHGAEWSSLMLVTGFPVWIHGDFVDELGSNMLKVIGERVNMRVLPSLAPGSIMGRFNDGDTLQILDKSNSWYQVNSPADFEGWVKTESLQDIL